MANCSKLKRKHNHCVYPTSSKRRTIRLAFWQKMVRIANGDEENVIIERAGGTYLLCAECSQVGFLAVMVDKISRYVLLDGYK